MAEARPTKKPLHWVGSSRDDLRDFPGEVRVVMAFALLQAELGGKHVDAKPMKGFGGAGVLEVVADHDGSTYRTVYTVKLRSAVYVLHAFQKKSTKGVATPQKEVDKIRERLKSAVRHHKDTYEQEDGAKAK
jgi:phage-related protein